MDGIDKRDAAAAAAAAPAGQAAGYMSALASALPGMDSEALDLAARYSSEAFARKGRALYYQGDEARAAYLLLEGRIRPLRVKGGSSTPLDEAAPGSWLGLAEAYSGLPYQADALAVEASGLRRFSRFNLMELLRASAFKDLAIAVLARESCLLHGALDAASAIERLARAIAVRADGLRADGLHEKSGDEASAAGSTIRLRCTQTELAEASGLTRETANRCLRRLETAGLIETGRGELLVYDLRGLRGYEEE